MDDNKLKYYTVHISQGAGLYPLNSIHTPTPIKAKPAKYLIMCGSMYLNSQPPARTPRKVANIRARLADRNTVHISPLLAVAAMAANPKTLTST